jgi:hypothetical protein
MLCSKCRKEEATATLHLTEDAVEMPVIELCAGCYRTFVPPEYSQGQEEPAQRDRYLHVTTQYHCVDQHGNSLGPPTPSKPAGIVKGLGELAPHIDRLFSSDSPFSSFTVFTIERKAGFGLRRQKGETSIVLMITRELPPDTESHVRRFFQRHGLPPKRDTLLLNDSGRCLDYTLPGSSEDVYILCGALLTDCFQVPKDQVFVVRG